MTSLPKSNTVSVLDDSVDLTFGLTYSSTQDTAIDVSVKKLVDGAYTNVDIESWTVTGTHVAVSDSGNSNVTLTMPKCVESGTYRVLLDLRGAVQVFDFEVEKQFVLVVDDSIAPTVSTSMGGSVSIPFTYRSTVKQSVPIVVTIRRGGDVVDTSGWTIPAAVNAVAVQNGSGTISITLPAGVENGEYMVEIAPGDGLSQDASEFVFNVQ